MKQSFNITRIWSSNVGDQNLTESLPSGCLNLLAVSNDQSLLFIACEETILVYDLTCSSSELPTLRRPPSHPSPHNRDTSSFSPVAYNHFGLNHPIHRIKLPSLGCINSITIGRIGFKPVLIAVTNLAHILAYFYLEPNGFDRPLSASTKLEVVGDNSAWSVAISPAAPIAAVGSNSHVVFILDFSRPAIKEQYEPLRLFQSRAQTEQNGEFHWRRVASASSGTQRIQERGRYEREVVPSQQEYLPSFDSLSAQHAVDEQPYEEHQFEEQQIEEPESDELSEDHQIDRQDPLLSLLPDEQVPIGVDSPIIGEYGSSEDERMNRRSEEPEEDGIETQEDNTTDEDSDENSYDLDYTNSIQIGQLNTERHEAHQDGEDQQQILLIPGENNGTERIDNETTADRLLGVRYRFYRALRGLIRGDRGQNQWETDIDRQIIPVGTIRDEFIRGRGQDDMLRLYARGHAHNVPHLRFSPEGHFLCSSSIDTTFRIWKASLSSDSTAKLKDNCVAVLNADEWCWASAWIPKKGVYEVDIVGCSNYTETYQNLIKAIRKWILKGFNSSHLDLQCSFYNEHSPPSSRQHLGSTASSTTESPLQGYLRERCGISLPPTPTTAQSTEERRGLSEELSQGAARRLARTVVARDQLTRIEQRLAERREACRSRSRSIFSSLSRTEEQAPELKSKSLESSGDFIPEQVPKVSSSPSRSSCIQLPPDSSFFSIPHLRQYLYDIISAQSVIAELLRKTWTTPQVQDWLLPFFPHYMSTRSRRFPLSLNISITLPLFAFTFIKDDSALKLLSCQFMHSSSSQCPRCEFVNNRKSNKRNNQLSGTPILKEYCQQATALIGEQHRNDVSLEFSLSSSQAADFRLLLHEEEAVNIILATPRFQLQLLSLRQAVKVRERCSQAHDLSHMLAQSVSGRHVLELGQSQSDEIELLKYQKKSMTSHAEEKNQELHPLVQCGQQRKEIKATETESQMNLTQDEDHCLMNGEKVNLEVTSDEDVKEAIENTIMIDEKWEVTQLRLEQLCQLIRQLTKFRPPQVNLYAHSNNQTFYENRQKQQNSGSPTKCTNVEIGMLLDQQSYKIHSKKSSQLQFPVELSTLFFEVIGGDVQPISSDPTQFVVEVPSIHFDSIIQSLIREALESLFCLQKLAKDTHDHASSFIDLWKMTNTESAERNNHSTNDPVVESRGERSDQQQVSIAHPAAIIQRPTDSTMETVQVDRENQHMNEDDESENNHETTSGQATLGASLRRAFLREIYEAIDSAGYPSVRRRSVASPLLPRPTIINLTEDEVKELRSLLLVGASELALYVYSFGVEEEKEQPTENSMADKHEENERKEPWISTCFSKDEDRDHPEMKDCACQNDHYTAGETKYGESEFLSMLTKRYVIRPKCLTKATPTQLGNAGRFHRISMLEVCQHYGLIICSFQDALPVGVYRLVKCLTTGRIFIESLARIGVPNRVASSSITRYPFMAPTPTIDFAPGLEYIRDHHINKSASSCPRIVFQSKPSRLCNPITKTDVLVEEHYDDGLVLDEADARRPLCGWSVDCCQENITKLKEFQHHYHSIVITILLQGW